MSAPGERVIFGAGPVRELLARRPKAIKAIWVDPRRADRSTSDPIAGIVTAARKAGILVEDRDRPQLDKACDPQRPGPDGRRDGALHQGVVAWLGAYVYADVDAMLAAATGAPLLVALDGVEDPRNLGAIIRSAYLLGAHGVLIPEHRAAAVTPLVAKTSAGASELLPIAQVGNLARTLEELREQNLWRVAIHASAQAQPIASIDGTMALCLVLGAEGTGIRPLVAKHCDFHAVIPMARAEVGSFNVSVAAALALYEISRQREQAG